METIKTMGGGDNVNSPLNTASQNSSICDRFCAFFTPTGKLKHDFILLFIPYFIAFFLMLLNTKGYYWDDWGLIGGFSFDEMNLQFKQNANIWYGYFEWIFISLQPYGIPLFRFFTFVGFFICGLLVYKISQRLEILTPIEIVFITLLFLLLPFNIISRNILINSPYTLCYILFWLGFYILSLYMRNSHFLLRIAALLCFFVSFTMNSLLVYFALPLAYMIYVSRAYISLKAFCQWSIKHIDFIILPIVFYVLKQLYFKPYGMYEGYNEVHLDAFFKAIIKTPIFSILHFGEMSYILLGAISFFFLLLIPVSFYYAYKHNRIYMRDIVGVGLGLLILWCGMFSYVVVYKYNEFLNAEDRFSILESLGAGIVIVFLLNILCKSQKLKTGILLILILCAINVNINALNQVFTAYIRQVGIFEHLKENPTFLQHDTFRVYGDMCGNKDICGESFYQLNGIYKKIFNKSDKFISMEIQAETEATEYCHKSPTYNCTQYKGDINVYGSIYVIHRMFVQDYTRFRGFLSMGKLYMLNIFAPQKFAQKAKERYDVVVFPPTHTPTLPST